MQPSGGRRGDLMYRLSKSKLLSALQCPKRLYLEIHEPDLAELDERVQIRFAMGHQVGEVARSLFAGGVLIEHQDNVESALRETETWLRRDGDLILFEPAVQHDGVLIRADILIRRNGRYRFLEVKSSTQVYDYHLQDAAIQAAVFDGAGYPVDHASILHIDSGFIYAGDGDYRKLFEDVDVTADIAELKDGVPDLVHRTRQMLEGPMPEIGVGSHCNHPFECPFLAYCDRDAPGFPVSILSSHWRLRDRLIAEGFRDIREIPLERIESRRLQRVCRSSASGQAELDPEAADVLRQLGYPRYYLDFETIQFAVPIWAGTSPYEQLPFQWSCHVQGVDGTLAHRGFLDISGQAPMRAFAESLIAALASDGPIIVYSGFEDRILGSLSDRFPDLAAPIEAVRGQLFDLLPMAREYYYHPEMQGSWSLKSVLPTVAVDLDYSNLKEVTDGSSAQAAYLEIIAPDTRGERKAQLAEALRVYCERDTLAMVRVADFFAGRGSSTSSERSAL